MKDSPIVFADRDGITTSFVNTPNIGATLSSDPAQWLVIELHYSVTLKPKQGDYLPAAQFKIWVEGRDLLDPQGKPGEGIAVALTGVASYVNIKQGQDRYASFYIHPSTIGRYNAGGGNDDFDRRFNIHAEAYIGGTMVDYYNKTKEKDALGWFKALRVVPSLVYLANQCPFAVFNPDRYPALKILEGAQDEVSSAPSQPPAPTPAPAPVQ